MDAKELYKRFTLQVYAPYTKNGARDLLYFTY